MIIDNKNSFNNNTFNNDTFNNKLRECKENAKKQTGNIFIKDIKTQKYSNVNNKDEMQDKALAMLNERLNKGTITMDEFSKQCEHLGNLKNK